MNDFLGSISDGISKFGDKVAHEIRSDDPAYRRFGRELEKFALKVAVVGLVAGCATVVFGTIALFTAKLAAIALTGLAAYGSCNAIVISGNVAKISKNTVKYLAWYGLSVGLDKDKLKKDLCENTFYCTRFLHGIVDLIDLAMKEEAKAKSR